MKSYKDILVEISLSRVNTHIQDRSIGSITANRRTNTPEQNLTANRVLEKSIKDAGHGYVHLRGRYIEGHNTPEAHAVDEHSYLVMAKQRGDDKGELKNFLLKHGEKHNQDSILYKSHDDEIPSLIGTSDRSDAWPGKGKSDPVGKFHPNKMAEFHSVLFGKESKAPESKGHTKGSGPRSFTFTSESFVDFDINTIEEALSGREALDKATQEKGFGKPNREQELLTQKKEMEARHSKADAESAQRTADWKAKYGDKLKESFSLDKFRDADKKTDVPEKQKAHRKQRGKIPPSKFDKEEEKKPIDYSSFDDYADKVTKTQRYT